MLHDTLDAAGCVLLIALSAMCMMAFWALWMAAAR